MLFNGFLVYGDSDTSDVTKSSTEPLSLAESSASGSSRGQTLEDRLQATLQILKNKEETVRVQAESLSLAEARIAELSRRVQANTADTSIPLSKNYPSRCGVETNDASANASLQGTDRSDVNSLRKDLTFVEDLYRECFYETAKQEEMLDKLRRSYREMRVMDEQKAEKIGRLQRAHRWSLARYQDIAGEVEHLKSEIMSFISGSNNDSGVWGGGVGGGGVEEELAGGLRHVADQLLRLKDMLADECTCGLEEENKKLKQINDSLKEEMSQFRERVRELEATLQDKENLDKKREKLRKVREEELHLIRRLSDRHEGARDQASQCDTVTDELHRLRGILNDKVNQLEKVEAECQRQTETIEQLRDQVKKAEGIAKENSVVREEVRQLAAQVSHWRQQLARGGRRVRALETDLRAAREQCAHLAGHCSEKGAIAASLQELVSEQAREAGLRCDARRAVSAVRDVLRGQRRRQREQEETIKQQESLIRALRERAGTSRASDEPCCPCAVVEARWSERSCGLSETARCSRCPSPAPSSLSTTPPIPPRRLLRKKSLCGDRNCTCGGQVEGNTLRRRAEVELHSLDSRHQHSTNDGQLSPSGEAMARVECAHAALRTAQRRWGRRAARSGACLPGACPPGACGGRWE